MSHHKHTTEAFILNVMPAREHDARVKMITKDGEVLSAIATGLRTLKSKLRMSVVPYSHLNASIVRGKDTWRLTNAQSVEHFYDAIADKEAKKALARTVSLVELLTPGEMHVGNIFEILLAYAKDLSEGKAQGKIKAYETQAALRVLSELGYIESAEKWNDAGIEYIEAHIAEAVRDVNHGIKSTHLM
jgi:recombinational DNA repair protein (RecF pathway)